MVDSVYARAKVETVLRKVKGVKYVKQLHEEDLKRILELEQEAEKKVMMGMARGFNHGLREVLKREVVLAIGINPEFRHPPESTMVWMFKDEIIGEELTDPKKVKELKGRADVKFISKTFAIYKDKLRKLPLKETLILFPPLSFPELQVIREIGDAISTWPSVSVDIYIKRAADWKTNDSKLGTMLIGFNNRI